MTTRTVPVDTAELPGRPCSLAAALELVGERWSLLVIREVTLGQHRFSQILAGTGAPRDRLAARLALLVEVGVLERRRYSEHPERWEYHLTDSGWALRPVLNALRQWGDAHAVVSPPARLVHGDDRHVVHGVWTCDVCRLPVDGSHARLVGA